ncbi:4a-hydroxytetrahydrobiopterin dehydratase [Georgenia sp. TF02-10]|uniref:VOC family protein n=1 Tax=Georgenia sp. TF02-10 TaxID=2917725 RepID=UPI001FA75224|nr:VOC family protein [Georgenia sp. TF02-10]UNX53908.1 4a-hydroxytetrahydrobiopterin dehydratase [Georgenia sp. TF02-10]
MTRLLPAGEVQARPGLQEWRVVGPRLVGTFRTGSLARGIELARRIGDVAEELDHHPDLDLRYHRVHVSLITYAAGGLTERDVALGERISTIARELGLRPEPHRCTAVEIAVDALDIAAVLPFWQAVLGYKRFAPPGEEETSVDLVDPAGRGPALWFQQMDAPRPGRNRIHLDVHVPADHAPARVAAALAAGGHLVTDAHAPSWWVLADAEGNEACVCTWQEEPAG